MKKANINKPISPQKQNIKKNSPAKTSYSWWMIALCGMAAFVAFIPALQNELTNWDDPNYIVDNPLIRSLSSENIKRIFTESYFGNYQPLHILSYAIEYHFFGISPKGYHAVSIILHALCAISVFIFVSKLSKNNYIAVGATLLFALSPLRTESVCWASERKDLLYAFFFFIAAIYYIKYLQKDLAAKYYIITLLFFILAVLSKVMAVSFVPVMFLLDYWYQRKWNAKLILDKIIFVLVSLTMGIVELKVVKDEGTIDATGQYNFMERIFFASHNCLMYVVKMIVPFNQSAYYPYPERVGQGIPMQYYAAIIFPLILIGLLIYTFKKNKTIFFGLAFFIVTVFLVLMLVPVGPTIFSERYTYIPCLGIYLILCTFLYEALQKNKQQIAIYLSCVGIFSVIYFTLTNARCKVWKTSITLWTDATQQFPTAGHALNNLGDAYYKLGQIPQAEENFNKAIKYNPNYAQAWFNRANCYGQTGKYQAALNDLNKAISLDQKYTDAYTKRGQAYSMLNQPEAAKADYAKSLELKPNNPEIYYNLGVMYINMNNKQEACVNFGKAASMNFDAAIKAYNEVCK